MVTSSVPASAAHRNSRHGSQNRRALVATTSSATSDRCFFLVVLLAVVALVWSLNTFMVLARDGTLPAYAATIRETWMLRQQTPRKARAGNVTAEKQPRLALKLLPVHDRLAQVQELLKERTNELGELRAKFLAEVSLPEAKCEALRRSCTTVLSEVVETRERIETAKLEGKVRLTQVLEQAKIANATCSEELTKFAKQVEAGDSALKAASKRSLSMQAELEELRAALEGRGGAVRPRAAISESEETEQLRRDLVDTKKLLVEARAGWAATHAALQKVQQQQKQQQQQVGADREPPPCPPPPPCAPCPVLPNEDRADPQANTRAEDGVYSTRLQPPRRVEPPRADPVPEPPLRAAPPTPRRTASYTDPPEPVQTGPAGCGRHVFDLNTDRPMPQPYAEIPVSSANRCRKMCNEHAKCRGWVFVTERAVCRLQARIDMVSGVPDECCISGLIC